MKNYNTGKNIPILEENLKDLQNEYNELEDARSASCNNHERADYSLKMADIEDEIDEIQEKINELEKQ